MQPSSYFVEFPTDDEEESVENQRESQASYSPGPTGVALERLTLKRNRESTPTLQVDGACKAPDDHKVPRTLSEEGDYEANPKTKAEEAGHAMPPTPK